MVVAMMTMVVENHNVDHSQYSRCPTHILYTATQVHHRRKNHLMHNCKFQCKYMTKSVKLAVNLVALDLAAVCSAVVCSAW